MEHDIVVTAVVMSATLLLIVGGLAVLLVMAHNRRVRHRAELAELQLHHARAVMQAEREAISHTLREVGVELHDSVGQRLTVAQNGLRIESMQGALPPHLVSVAEVVNEAVEEVRRMGKTLHTDFWKHSNLADAIGLEALRMERLGRMAVHMVRKGDEPALMPDTSTILFRAFQEAVNNSLKHSGADTLRIDLVTLDAEGRSVRLTIADNGRGFDPLTVKRSSGLVNIPTRCALVGYAARCDTAPGSGCTWTFEPLRHDGKD